MSVGSVISIYLTSRLMRYGWQNICYAYSLVGIAWAVLFFTVFRTRPGEVPWLRRATLPPARDEAVSRAEANDVGLIRPAAPVPFSRILASGTLWALVIQGLCKAAGYNFLVTYYRDL